MAITNQIATVAAGQKALDTLKLALAPIKAFSSDFSAEMVRGNNYTVQVPIIGSMTADTTANSYETTGNTSVTKADVSLDKKQFVDVDLTGFDQYKLSNVDYLSGMLSEAVYAVGKAAVQDILSNVTAANYTETPPFAADPAGFDIDALVDCRKAANLLGYPPNMRYLVLNSDFTSSLLKDSKYMDAEGRLGMMNPFLTGTLPNIRGLQIIESDVIPNNSESLGGFLAIPSCMACAFALVDAVELESSLSVARSTIITDPVTNISFGIYEHINTATRTQWLSVEIRYGYVKTKANALLRIKSAA